MKASGLLGKMRSLAERREVMIVLMLCLIAGLRVFLFSAAFPFFSNVDEPAHFDMVCKYAEGQVPGSLENNCDESATMMTLYNSPEFFFGPNDPAMHPPLWTLLPETVAPYMD